MTIIVEKTRCNGFYNTTNANDDDTANNDNSKT